MVTLHTNSILRERYKITNMVGKGGMGSVYRAEDLRLPGRLCAIKVVEPDPNLTVEQQRQAQSQFLQEASILAQLDHPNLPKVSDFFSEDNRDFLVMDFVPGDDLKEILEAAQGPLPEKQVLSWAKQIVAGLSHLHRQKPPVLHRDIKPANIKLTPDDRIKLVDFGLVKLMVPDDARTITVVQGRGTVLYTPLEQYGGGGGHTDARTDIYALGGTLYQLLTNTPPLDAKSRFLNPHKLKPPMVLNPAVSPTVSDAVMWALRMHPDDRPDTVRQFYRVLSGKEPLPGRKTAVTTTQLFTEAMKENWIPIILAFALFLMAVLLTII
ncbi:MAG: protein kinase [Chloroflexi bacterium]|nr:MAG: protein kinase [Chloroflexota bacterium]PIE82457.1 MAG: protein kinase [Chloroflexota bacterium]